MGQRRRRRDVEEEEEEEEEEGEEGKRRRKRAAHVVAYTFKDRRSHPNSQLFLSKKVTNFSCV